MTDADFGENITLQFQLDNLTRDVPFDINVDTGDILVTGELDFETITIYQIDVTVTDSGMQPRQSSNSYFINIINENDIPPRFSAPAYFGEIYAHIPVNDYVRHTILRVRDEDVPEDEQDVVFQISFARSSHANLGYAFAVVRDPPYYIRVIQSPNEASINEPHLLELQVTATDDGGRGLASTVPLYISIFTVDNLISFDVAGVTEEELLSCEKSQSSICGFREALSNVMEQTLGEPVSFFNNSLRMSERDTTV